MRRLRDKWEGLLLQTSTPFWFSRDMPMCAVASVLHYMSRQRRAHWHQQRSDRVKYTLIFDARIWPADRWNSTTERRRNRGQDQRKRGGRQRLRWRASQQPCCSWLGKFTKRWASVRLVKVLWFFVCVCLHELSQIDMLCTPLCVRAQCSALYYFGALCICEMATGGSIKVSDIYSRWSLSLSLSLSHTHTHVQLLTRNSHTFVYCSYAHVQMLITHTYIHTHTHTYVYDFSNVEHTRTFKCSSSHTHTQIWRNPIIYIHSRAHIAHTYTNFHMLITHTHTFRCSSHIHIGKLNCICVYPAPNWEGGSPRHFTMPFPAFTVPFPAFWRF